MKKKQEAVRKEILELEEELSHLQKDELLLSEDVRAASRQGNDGATHILAREIVRVRERQNRLKITLAQLRGIYANISTVESMSKTPTAVSAATHNMKPMQVSASDLSKDLHEQNRTQEDLDQAFDQLMEMDELDRDTDEAVQNILLEAGEEVKLQMPFVPTEIPVRVRTETSQTPSVRDDVNSNQAVDRLQED